MKVKVLVAFLVVISVAPALAANSKKKTAPPKQCLRSPFPLHGILSAVRASTMRVASLRISAGGRRDILARLGAGEFAG
jgi:hypothetical protein